MNDLATLVSSPENVELRALFSVVLLMAVSLCFRVLLSYCGQSWIRTFPQTATLLVLPIITFTITKVISGNIALSLGMVGALSIVRFRNPVKSPFELAIYFGAITMGITASVSLNWLLFFVVTLLLAALLLITVNIGSRIISRKSFLELSFGEGVKTSTLLVKTTGRHLALENSQMLTSKIAESAQFTYILSSTVFAELNTLSKNIDAQEGVIFSQLTR